MTHGIAPPSFRLPDKTHVGGVRLLVSNLPRSLEYYQQVIGLRVYTATADTATLGPHGDEQPLVRLQTRSGVTPARQGAFGLYHFAMLMPDRAALGRFTAHLSTLGERIGMADHLISEALYLTDPDGLGIEMYADRPHDTWQYNGQELIMAVDPLDTGDLIAAGRGETWNGAPAGTTMGHVHLHVGDLSEAEAFYHRGLGFAKTAWSLRSALFMSAGGYHHHLATNIWAPGPSPSDDQARLLEWELVVPSVDDAAEAGSSLRAAGYEAEDTPDGVTAADVWGTRVSIRS